MLEIINTTKTKIDTQFLQKAAQAAFAILCIKKDVSLVLVNDAKIKAINKKYRHKNAVTDVLSFEGLNEIFICLPQARRQAKFNPPTPPFKRGAGGLVLRQKEGRLDKANLLKTSLKTELTRLLTHGIVHLKGYDHVKSASEVKRMFRVEEKIFKNLPI